MDKTRLRGQVSIEKEWADFVRARSPVHGHGRNLKMGLQIILDRYKSLFREVCQKFTDEQTFSENEITLLVICLERPGHLHPYEMAEHLGTYIEREAFSRRLHIELSPYKDKHVNPLDLKELRARIDGLTTTERLCIVDSVEFYWLYGQGTGLKVADLWMSHLNRWPDHTIGPRRPLMPRVKKG